NFIYGAKPTHKLGILQCDTWGGIEDCQKVKTAELESSKSDIKWRGTYRYALELLIGEQDETTFSQGRYRIVPNSLVDKLRKDASAGNLLFTERQYDFWVNSSLISPQAKVALNETAIRQSDEITILVAQMIAKEVARQMGAEYAGSLVETVRGAYNRNLPNNKRKAILSPTQRKALDELEKEVRKIEDSKIAEYNKIVEMANAINRATRQTLPNVALAQ
ncbi:MAG: hypothetical protein IJ143_09695, partial [Neisseriaceae bacterium]|nr:hypothetical protein [Neisseriaceae bacterium]